MERNPHLLFEGCLIGCWAIGAKVAYIYIRGEFYHVQRILEAELAKAYAQHRQEHPWLGFDCDIVIHRGAARTRGRRRDGAHRVARRQARAAADQAALPGGVRSLQLPDSRQQRRNALQPACDHYARRGMVRGDGAGEERRPEALLRQRAREEAWRLRGGHEDDASGADLRPRWRASAPGISSRP